MPHFSRGFLSLLSFVVVLAIIVLNRENEQPDERAGKYPGMPEFVQLPELFTTGQLQIRHWTNQYGALVYFLHLPAVSRLDVYLTYNAGYIRHEDPLVPYLVNKLPLFNSGLHAYIKRMNLQITPILNVMESGIHLQTFKQDEFLWPSIKLLQQYANGHSLQNNYSLGNIRKLVAQQGGHIDWVDRADDDYPSLETLLGFYQRYYGVNNLTFSIIGDISIEQAGLIADRLTAKMQNTLEEDIEVNRVGVEGFYRQFHSSPYTLLIPFQYGDADDVAALELSVDIIESHLQQELVQTGVRWIKSARVYYPGHWQLICHLSLKEPLTHKQLTEAINKIVTPIVYVGPTHKQIDKVKQARLSLWNLQRQDQQWLGKKLTQIAFNQWSGDYFRRYERNLEVVDRKQLQAIMKTSVALDKIQLIYNHTKINQQVAGGKINGKNEIQ